MKTLKELLDSGQVTVARKEAERLLTRDPENPEALVTVVKSLLVDGKLPEADALISRLEVKRGATTDVLVLRASLAAQRGDTATAKALYQQATQRAPPRAEAYFGLGCLLAWEGQLAGSAQTLEKAVELAPTHGVYRYHLAQNLFRVDKPLPAVDHLERAIALNPLYPPSYVLMARILTVIGKVDGARQVLEAGLGLMPGELSLLSELTNDLLVGGDPKGANQAAVALAMGQPDDPVAQSNAANLLLAQGRFDEALRVCQAMERKGLSTAALKNVEATVHESREPVEWDQAIRAYEEGMALDPHDWTAANNLGLLLLRRPGTRHLARAITVLEEAHRRRPGQLEPRLNLAIACARGHQPEKAKALATALLGHTLPPSSPIRDQAERLVKALAREQAAPRA